MKPLFDSIHLFLWKIKVTLQELRRQCKYHKKLNENLKYQNLYSENQRCFVIGNGPSLREEDLDKLTQYNEISFAANRIYKLYPDTEWRPTYYGVCDTKLFIKSEKEIESVASIKFLALDIYDKCVENSKKEKYHVFSRAPFSYIKKEPRFSDKINRQFGEGGTITYHLLQLAVSMGFKEIYLIGCDFSFSFGIGTDGKYFEDKSIKQNHIKQDQAPVDTMPNLFVNLLAFQSAQRFARKNGIKIFNATRGGKLEVFERRDFDSLFT